MKHSLKFLEEERIVLKMKSGTGVNNKNLDGIIKMTKIPSTSVHHYDSLNHMIMEDSLTGNMKFAELLSECDRHIHQIPAFPSPDQ